MARKMPHRQQKSRARELSLLGSQSLFMGVFSNDFATVDVREELCYHSRPEKANSRVVAQKREIERLYNEENQKGNKPVKKRGD